jgi:Tfp pilus assembly protein FimT
MKRKRASGLSAVEIVIAIAILAALVTISAYSFLALSRRSAVDVSASIVRSVLSEARSKSLAGEVGDRYGVQFSSSSVTMFKGSTYSSSASTNIVTSINSKVTISNVALASGVRCSGATCIIVFNRLTGETSQAGTSTITLIGSDSSSTTVTVYGTGIVE